jgi:WD40 repeat protein
MAQDDTFHLISTADWTEIGTLVPPDYVAAWALSPSGSLLAIASGDLGNEIFLLDYHTEAVSSPLELPGAGMIASLTFSPDGRLLAVLSGDSVIRLLGVAP